MLICNTIEAPMSLFVVIKIRKNSNKICIFLQQFTFAFLTYLTEGRSWFDARIRSSREASPVNADAVIGFVKLLALLGEDGGLKTD